MLNILSDKDTILRNSLLVPQNTTVHPSISILLNTTQSENYGHAPGVLNNYGILVEKFKYIFATNTPISTILCSKISKFLIKRILYASTFTEFPKDLFHGVFLDFIVSEDLLFNKRQVGLYRTSLFDKIMSSESDYFRLIFDKHYINEYISHAKSLHSFINTQSMTYVILSRYEIIIVLNFLKLIIEIYDINTVVTDDIAELQSAGLELYKIIYNSLANMLLINLESAELYDQTYMVQNYTNLGTTTKYYISVIGVLNKMQGLQRLLLAYIRDIDVDIATSDQIHLIAYSLNENTHIFNEYERYKQIFKPVIVNLLKSTTVNIHDKCKLILTIDDFDEHILPELINIFINIEDCVDSEFKLKIKIRSKILKATSGITKHKGFITDNFLTLYTNHINNILGILEDTLKDFGYYPIEANRITVIKYVYFLIEAIDYNIDLITLFQSQSDNLYYFKLVESTYSLLESIMKIKLYTFIQIGSTTDIYITSVMNDLFLKIFRNIQLLGESEQFIESWANNSFFYNEDTFRESIHCYGYLEIIPDTTVKIILNSIAAKIDLKITQLSETEKNYLLPIPEKFKDPIMLSVIKIPLEIPSVKVIVDKYTIYNHLFFNKTNPYTNEPLTVYKLDEYNKEPGTVQRVEAFIQEFEEWKLLHQIK